MDLNIFAVVVATSVSGALGAYFGAYLKRKGENLATKEDLEAITRTTEAIKAQISNDVWDRQRRWETKRDAPFAVTKALSMSDNLLTALLSTFDVTRGADFDEASRQRHRAEVRTKWMAADDVLSDAIALASVVCTMELHRSLRSVSAGMKKLALAAHREEATTMEHIQKEIVGVRRAIRDELRLGD